MGTGGAFPAGFGFKVKGNALKGFSTRNFGEEEEIDLNTPFVGLSVESEATQVKLLTVRRANAIDYYVDGVLKGTATTFLPESTPHRVGYLVQAVGALRVEVGCLTIGIPMF